jgi:hypothetical protein
LLTKPDSLASKPAWPDAITKSADAPMIAATTWVPM